MNADPDPGLAPVQVPGGDGGTPHVDARRAVGVQVGQDNTQIIYNYGELTWTDGVGPPPLVAVSGRVDSPYRGLGAFEERDAPFFFGREAAVTDVLKRMSRCVDGTGLLVVSGVSGAGKSSLLRAGVLPQIRGLGLAAAPEAARWPCLLVTPGPAPLDVLAVQVAHLAGVDAAAVRRGLDDDPARFALTARQAALAQPGGPLGDPGSSPPGPLGEQRLLLMVDQFEQVFTQCSDEKQRQVFIAALCAAAAKGGLDQDPAALIVLGVRADFEARCADYPQLADAIQDRYLVTSMTERQLRMAITEPAKKVGSSVDEDLVDVLLEEVSTRQPASSPAVPGRGSVSGAGILPLLSHALDEAWRSRAGGVLTLADYERTGGIEGAVADSAQHAYNCLTPAQQAAARQVFIRLTATSSESVDISDRASRAELTEGKDAAQARDVEAVLEAFASERLLTLAAGTVEISHEVLLTAWPLLRDTWLAETHADRIVRTRLHNAAADWDRRSRDPSYLYSGSLLQDAAATAARISADPVRYPSLSPTERDFIRASERARRRRVRRREVIMASLMVLVVGLAFVAFLAVRNGQETASERNSAVSELFASQSETIGDSNPVISKMLSVAAYRIDPSDRQATYAMLAAGALPGINVIRAGSSWAYSVAFSPHGNIVASGNYDGTIRLWNAATGQQIGKTLNDGRSDEVLSVAFSPDGKTLASGGSDGTIQLWNVATGQQIRPPLNGNAGPVNSVAFSPNGTTLASGSNKAVQLWNAATGQLTDNHPVSSDIGYVNSVAFSHNGQTLASGNQNGTIQLWNAAAGQLTESFFIPSNNGPVNCVAFSYDDQTLASGSNGEVQLWNAATGQPTGILQTGDVKSVNSVAFSPDGSTLASGGSDDTVRLWDVATLKQIGPSLTGHTGWVESVAFSRDGSILASSSNDQTVRLWNVAIAKPMGEPASDGAAPVYSVAFSPNSKILADGNASGTVRLIEAATGQQLASLVIHGAGAVNSIACSQDGKTLASGYANGTIRLWDVLNDHLIGNPLPGGAGAVRSVAFSRNGKTLASGYADGTIRLWDVASGHQIGPSLNGHAGQVNSVAFSPNGTTLASGTAGTKVQLWDVATGQQVHAPLTGHTYAVQSVAFSSQDMLASSSQDYTIRLWNPATGQLAESPLTGDTDWVNSVAFSPNGQILASGSADGTVRLWDVATGQQIGAPFSGQTGLVNSVAFSPDGQTLASGDADGTVQLWDVAYMQDIVSDLCASAGRSLTPAQWAPYAQDLAYQNICP